MDPHKFENTWTKISHISFYHSYNFPNKGDQHFHTDGKYEERMYLMSVATEDITESSGPTEVVLNSHNKTPYWKFLFKNKNIPNSKIYNLAKNLDIGIVLTAHPTEVKRRPLIQKYHNITEILGERDQLKD